MNQKESVNEIKDSFIELSKDIINTNVNTLSSVVESLRLCLNGVIYCRELLSGMLIELPPAPQQGGMKDCEVDP